MKLEWVKDVMEKEVSMIEIQFGTGTTVYRACTNKGCGANVHEVAEYVKDGHRYAAYLCTRCLLVTASGQRADSDEEK